MSILIRDETANATVLTIDNNGNMFFGDGTPVSPVTIAGQQIIDSNGFIVHGLGSCSVNGVSGSVDCPITQTVDVGTVPGRLPSVQLDTHYPAQSYVIVDDPNGAYSQQSDLNGEPAHTARPGSGFFEVSNKGFYSTDIGNPNSPFFNPNVLHDPCGYRWI